MNVYDRLLELTGSDILIDSSKTVPWISRQLRIRWHWRTIEPYVIYIHRDGRAVVNSYLRHHPDRTIEAVTRSWVQNTDEIERYYAGLPTSQKTSLAYERLATEPEASMQRLCRAIDIQYEPDMLHFWTKVHHTVFGNEGTYASIRNQARRPNDAGLTSGLNSENAMPEVGSSATSIRDRIRLDERWRTELSQEQQDIFQSLAGKRNQKYRYEP